MPRHSIEFHALQPSWMEAVYTLFPHTDYVMVLFLLREGLLASQKRLAKLLVVLTLRGAPIMQGWGGNSHAVAR